MATAPDLSGRPALATGSARGIGPAIAVSVASATTGAAVRVDGGHVDGILP